MTNRTAVLSALALQLGIGQLVCASDLAHTRATLRGIRGVYVVVEELDSEIEATGLIREQLQNDAELLLRKAEILVMGEQDYLNTPHSGLLYININAMRGDMPFYAVAIDVSFKQRVLLEREPRIKTLAETWSSDELILVRDNIMVRETRDNVVEHVEKFIRAYSTWNPR